MPAQTRFKTSYPGVYYIEGTGLDGKPERIYILRYRKDGKLIEEKAGRQFRNAMTPAKASKVRERRAEGKELTNTERRDHDAAKKAALEGCWTIARLWDAYLENRTDLKGIVTDRNRFTKHIKPTLGHKEPGDLIALDVDRLRLGLLKKRSPATVRNVLELLRRIVNFSIEKKGLAPLPFKIEMPAVDNQVTEDLAPEQLQALLEAIDADTHTDARAIMKMALYTGMRRGELFKLKWSDLDFNRGFIKIRDPKGRVSQTIPLNEAARTILEQHPRTESDFVFPGRKGNQRTDIKKAVNRIRAAAGLPASFRPLHGLRHVYASMLASSGQVDLYTLQKLLTHKSPAMTQRYAHLRDEALRRASNLAGTIIDQAIGAVAPAAEDQGAPGYRKEKR